MSKSQPKSTLLWLLLLEILLCFAIYLVCVCIRRRSRRFRADSKQDEVLPRGLDLAILESFPVIPCTAIKDAKPGNALECAVCLSSFRDDQTLRFIPKCEHVFHPDCVDPWFRLHSTCPYCRAYLAGPVPRQHDGFGSAGSGHVDEPDSVVIGVVSDDNDHKYTLRLSDEVWRKIMLEDDTCHIEDSRRVSAGERCPAMGRRGGGDADQEASSVS